MKGIHHITAIAGSAAGNLAFYTQVLGLRLVKKTVNFDDPYTYHLYYGDAAGTPGTILTFFPWEHLPQGRPGPGMVTAMAFAIAKEAVDFWLNRLRDYKVEVQRSERFGEPVVRLNDPDGLGLELIGIPGPVATSAWESGPVPAAEAIKGFHSATQVVRNIDHTQALLAETMGMRPEGVEGKRHRFRMSQGLSPGGLYDLVVDAGAAGGLQGAGSVHHIAFRTPSDAAQAAWQSLLRQKGLHVTPIRDRAYFRSIYFHEPGGVLFEIATEAPGFAIDERPEHLGRALKLPPQYELMRGEIERHLKPLDASGPADRPMAVHP
ncbi:MAG: ring-cleaving dioxygenase [Desulfobacteraceae bacterium]|nr:MAG: ring-cleaving dioxygenase [Desulfobacteraceae bacterium]